MSVPQVDSSPVLILNFLFDVLQRILGDVSLQVSRKNFCCILQISLIVLRQKHRENIVRFAWVICPSVYAFIEQVNKITHYSCISINNRTVFRHHYCPVLLSGRYMNAQKETDNHCKKNTSRFCWLNHMTKLKPHLQSLW